MSTETVALGKPKHSQSWLALLHQDEHTAWCKSHTYLEKVPVFFSFYSYVQQMTTLSTSCACVCAHGQVCVYACMFGWVYAHARLSIGIGMAYFTVIYTQVYNNAVTSATLLAWIKYLNFLFCAFKNQQLHAVHFHTHSINSLVLSCFTSTWPHSLCMHTHKFVV